MIYLNQKMNLTKDELTKLIKDIKDLDVILFPTMPLLSLASDLFPNIGSQDVSEYVKGNYTGQTSIETLKSLGVKYCLLGHSEKKKYLNESYESIVKKIELCKTANITPIYIIGESEEEKGNRKEIIESQITNVFNNLHCDLKNIVICYEPVWSISKDAPSSEYITDMIDTIKEIILDYYGEKAKVLYGGGVSLDNIDELIKIKSIDGFLIGNASLNADKVKYIYDKTK